MEATVRAGRCWMGGGEGPGWCVGREGALVLCGTLSIVLARRSSGVSVAARWQYNVHHTIAENIMRVT